MSSAGDSTASGHRSSGANAAASAPPASSASPRRSSAARGRGSAHAAGAVTTAALSAALMRSGPARAVRGPLFRRLHVARRDHLQGVDAAAVGALHAELEALEAQALAAARQPPELLHDEAGDGVHALLFREV